ncbi:hypothetical protein [Micromonospora haikouensis]|uniref:hypothetical protein n=1 Tax=Micromonospora haikouensis TaxID=686309 RepID=UPI003D72D35F
MNVSTAQIHRHLVTAFHGTDVADEIASVRVTRAARGYVVSGFVTDGARDRVARIIRAEFAAEADTVTGRVVASGTSVHVQIGPAEDTPAPAPVSAEQRADAVATLATAAEAWMVAVGNDDEQAAVRAATRTVSEVLRHLPAATEWTRPTTIPAGFYASRMNGSACLVGDQRGEPRQLTAHFESPTAVILAGVRVSDPAALDALAAHLAGMAARMREGGQPA